MSHLGWRGGGGGGVGFGEEMFDADAGDFGFVAVDGAALGEKRVTLVLVYHRRVHGRLKGYA